MVEEKKHGWLAFEEFQDLLGRAKASAKSDGIGYERAQLIPGSTYRDQSTVVIVPSRENTFHHFVVQSWMGLQTPMNQRRYWLFAIGDEVGHAYNNLVTEILKNPDLASAKYILTLESDNLPPGDAHLKLHESLVAGNYDAVGGLYWTKGDVNQPMCYGDPEHYKRTGQLEFQPRDVRAAVANGHVVECNGLAMGCTLYKMDLFKETPPPWFVTFQEVIPEKGAAAFTQDLWACKRWKEMGKRFACDTRVRVGHLDVATSTIY
jgi:hypothetical protein